MTMPRWRRTALNVLVLVLGFALAWFLVLLWLTDASAEPPGPRAGPAACTAYASPQGSGSACTESQPCLVGTWLGTHAAPGKVLCMADGVYRGEQSMLTLTSVNGTEGQPITIRALNDGGPLIDGGFGARPLDCNGAWLTVEGLDLKNGNDTTLVLRGQHCTARRVVAWASPHPADGAIENIADIGGSHNLLEDVGLFGFSRKIAACGARGGNGPNTLRRVWAEHNGAPVGSAAGNPTETIEIGYDQNNCVGENVIARRNILSSATQPEAPLHVFSTHGSALLGSIAYAVASDSIEVHTMLNIVPEAGSHEGSGHVTSDFLAQDIVLYAEKTHTNIRGMQIDGGSGSTGNVANRIVAVAPQGAGACGGSGWNCSEIYGGRTLAEALPGKTVWDTLPGICKRVVNRQITDVGLWPLPMTQRIKDALAAARMPTRDATAHVQSTLGEIPAKCRSDGTAPPEPPVPPTPPGPHVPLACTGTIVAVPGTVQMSCVPQEGRR